MANPLFLGAVGALCGFAMLQLLLRQYFENTDVLQRNWLYLSILATFTAGESLLKKRHDPCIFLVFQRRHLKMHKQYAKTVRMVVTENDHAGVKGTRVTTCFVTAHAP